jgi:hypothetical protein
MALPLTPRRKVIRGHRCIEPGLLSTLHRGQQFVGMNLLMGGMEAESGHAGSLPACLISKPVAFEREHSRRAAEVEDAFVALQARIGQRTLCDKLSQGV